VGRAVLRGRVAVVKDNHPSSPFPHLSRPVEDCAGCPALAGVRNLGLDDLSAGRPDSHCNSGDRRTGAGRAAAALSQFPQSGAVRAELFGRHAVTQ
jgi:hypothetical protein